MTDRVTVNVHEGVADVRLNRPDKLNALDMATFDALAQTGDALAADPSVRAVVLSGEGRAFSAGLDFANFAAMAGDGAPDSGSERFRRLAQDITAREPGRITNLGQQAAHVWRELPQPVIAAVHGHALGGGLQIALGADIRIVAPDAKLSILEIRWGLVPDMTGTAALIRLVGEDVAKELTFTGRMVSGEEAARIGLATRTADDPHTAATELAREIAGNSPDAVRGAKRLLNRAADIDLADQYLEESRTLGALRGTPNQVEAVHAYFEKRPPTFTNPT
ncbi:crotonase/enoyl-CoA hydratase family protein [Actinomadura madurae]|uniref:crotonase/enoyl-CoA hydratase family protein n=1 Tax=Actinomadura madurae TaxID=1993 RepID=UPI0020264EB3|nr:crotonase/enoyl-CoA hydratase family protein [Actinomadura madurae]MCP9977271.1 crotonase/enoyl-CoA hydratase family protein [Actinomadura madurae]MCQ0011220.1 crotonase/enoyl-CoA hydratase family protein [Actinomadura madurae]URN04409.1 crotonase/enoyl-CoA hydratase family protein [Actinomadura madurae]